MRFYKSDVLWLRVGPDAPFDPNIHYPLRAGENAQGDTLYLVAIVSDELRFQTLDAELHAFSKADLGNEELYRQGKSVFVIVLRYSPNAFPYDYPSDPTEDSSYRTGPFFWRPLKF